MALAVCGICAYSFGLCFAAGTEPANLALVQDSKSQYTIVIPTAASPQEQLAGAELAKYLKQISGAELPVKSEAAGPKIVVVQAKDGKGPAGVSFTKEEADYDAFVIKTDGKDLCLIGSNKRAVLYAVYTFLEKHLGCRWLTYGDRWQTEEQKKTGSYNEKVEECVPTAKTVSIPTLDERQKATMKYRGLRAGAWFGNTPMVMVDWAIKNKLNTFLMQGSSYVECMEAGGWTDVVVKNGMIPRGFILVLGHHQWRDFLPPEKYFKDHPEWFPLVGGKRIPGHRLNGQFCLSNAEAVKTLREGFSAFVKAHPEVDIFAPWPNDGYGWCECELCIKDRIAWEEDPKLQAPQDLYMRLVNQLNEDLQKLQPGKRISALAYINYAPPPAKEKPAPGLHLSYSNFRRNWYTASWGNAKGEVAAGPYAFKLHSQWLEKWLDLTRANGGEVTLYEYYADRYAPGFGFYLMHLIHDELAYFQKLGAAGCIIETHWSNRKTAPANLYIYAKQCWDPSLSTDDILAEYAKGRFGKAAEPMVKYLNEAERNSREFNRYFVRGKEADRDKSLADCEKYLEEAKSIVDTDQAKKNIADEEANFKKLKTWQLGK